MLCSLSGTLSSLSLHRWQFLCDFQSHKGFSNTWLWPCSSPPFPHSFTPHSLQGELSDPSQMAQLTFLDSCLPSPPLPPWAPGFHFWMAPTFFCMHWFLCLEGCLSYAWKTSINIFQDAVWSFPKLPSLPCSPGWAKSIPSLVPILTRISTILAYITQDCDGLELCICFLLLLQQSITNLMA